MCKYLAIQQRGNTLWLRGTFPPKSNSGKTKPHQQRISLRTKEQPQGVKATIAGLQYAEQQARAIALQLDKGQFNWADWQELILRKIELRLKPLPNRIDACSIAKSSASGGSFDIVRLVKLTS
ncbi:hypothetical protein [Brunnivagina elsteri]|uniref:hypothetical protein n=1 Tax=Brunnivagina elsteri TaxID=1247191 RepID=UPI001FEBF0B0|nr:hypothetical protein [Calothrix elsteri]